ncbi:hypothetical protein ONZ45_g18475 [Pleurotus djamor]|nr:hypothetical protein ONZ45_g18475 [Pleurotus djamor]
MGNLMSYVSNFEESLTTLEKTLTTPLPFVYSVHIRQCVSGYISWYAIAAFIYLGFLAAGEEIEQPFGYDDNDLDLDLFVQDIIHADIAHLKASPCLHAYFGPGATQPSHRYSTTSTGPTEDGHDPVQDLIDST